MILRTIIGRKVPCCIMKLNPYGSYFSPISHAIINTMSQPRSLILKTGGATRSPFLAKNCSWSKSKVFTSYYCNLFNFQMIILRLDCFQLHHPPVITTTCMLIFINYMLLIYSFYVKFTPWWYFKILILLKEQKKGKASVYTVHHACKHVYYK